MTSHGWTTLTLAGLVLAAACARPRTNPDTVSALVKENYVSLETRTDLKVESIETELPPQVDEYRLGVNDVLHITVVGHAEFTGAGTRGIKAKDGTQKQPAKKEPELREIEQRLLESLGTKVQLKGSISSGRIEVSYFSQDELDRLLDLLCGSV